MTMRPAMVERTNIRTTGDEVAGQSPRPKLNAVDVGKTQNRSGQPAAR